MIQVQQHGSVTAIRMARTLLGRPIYWTTAYWLDGLLIDSGPPVMARGLLKVLGNLPIEQILVTHAHEDHIGGLSLLHERYPHAPIYAPPQSIPFIQNPRRLNMQIYRRLLWGMPDAVQDVRPLPLIVETGLTETDRAETSKFYLRMIETPGHSQDHVSFFETRHRWLFSGDAFIGGQERSWRRDADMFSVVSSLRTIAALRPEKLFPGSGNVRQKVQPEIHGKIAHLISLCQDVDKLDAVGMPTAEIVDRLLGGETRMQFWTRGHFSGKNLVEACRSYNEILNPDSGSEEEADQPPAKRPISSSDSSTG